MTDENNVEETVDAEGEPLPIFHPEFLDHIQTHLTHLCEGGKRVTMETAAYEMGLLVDVPATMDLTENGSNPVTEANSYNKAMKFFIGFAINNEQIEGFDILAGVGGGIGLAGEKANKKGDCLDLRRLEKILADKLPAGLPATKCVALDSVISMYGGPGNSGQKSASKLIREAFKSGVVEGFALAKNGKTPVVKRS